MCVVMVYVLIRHVGVECTKIHYYITTYQTCLTLFTVKDNTPPIIYQDLTYVQVLSKFLTRLRHLISSVKFVN